MSPSAHVSLRSLGPASEKHYRRSDVCLISCVCHKAKINTQNSKAKCGILNKNKISFHIFEKPSKSVCNKKLYSRWCSFILVFSKHIFIDYLLQETAQLLSWTTSEKQNRTTEQREELVSFLL